MFQEANVLVNLVDNITGAVHIRLVLSIHIFYLWNVGVLELYVTIEGNVQCVSSDHAYFSLYDLVQAVLHFKELTKHCTTWAFAKDRRG